MAWLVLSGASRAGSPSVSPKDGVCVVELASMIGGEKFTDRPNCVCPVIGSFLRSWNDRAGYADRQRLHQYASRVVGTGGYRRISRIRRDLCLSYAGANLDRGPLRRAVVRLRMRGRIAWSVGHLSLDLAEGGRRRLRGAPAFARGESDDAFALLDRLLEVGSSPSVARTATATATATAIARTSSRSERRSPPALEPAPLADPVQRASQLGIAAAIGKLSSHPQVPEGEDRGQGADDRRSAAAT